MPLRMGAIGFPIRPPLILSLSLSRSSSSSLSLSLCPPFLSRPPAPPPPVGHFSCTRNFFHPGPILSFLLSFFLSFPHSLTFSVWSTSPFPPVVRSFFFFYETPVNTLTASAARFRTSLIPIQFSLSPVARIRASPLVSAKRCHRRTGRFLQITFFPHRPPSSRSPHAFPPRASSLCTLARSLVCSLACLSSYPVPLVRFAHSSPYASHHVHCARSSLLPSEQSTGQTPQSSIGG